jgi:hypothetical protein
MRARCDAQTSLLAQRYTTNFALKQLAESMEFTQHRDVQMTDEHHGIITSISGAKFLVDLVACTCTSGRYQVNNIPCGVAVACIVGGIDFFVKTKQWGIEVLKKGLRMEEHVKSFGPQGKYGK